MSRATRYAATIYFGLLMSGTLARPGWGLSPDPPSTADYARVVMPTAKAGKDGPAKPVGTATDAELSVQEAGSLPSPEPPGDLLR